MPPTTVPRLDSRGGKAPLRTPLSRKTPGQIEAEISEVLTRFENEFMGRGPEGIKTSVVDDMIVVRLRGLLTPGEKHLAATGPKGRRLVKQVRLELLEEARPQLEAVIAEITGSKVVSLHTDISTKTGERVIIFVMS